MEVSHRTYMSKRRLFQLMGLWATGLGVVLLILGWWLWMPLRQAGRPLLAVGVVWLLMTPWISKDPMRLADVRYMRMGLLAMGGYILALLVVRWGRDLALPTWGMGLLAMLPVLPMVWLVFAMWRFVRESDELERRVLLEASFVAFVLVGLLTFAVGMLESVGVLQFKAGMVFVFPLMLCIFGMVLWCIRRKYGLSGIGC